MYISYIYVKSATFPCVMVGKIFEKKKPHRLLKITNISLLFRSFVNAN